MKTFILYVIFGVGCFTIYHISHNEEIREQFSDIVTF